MTTHFSNLRGRTGNVAIQKGKIYYIKIKIVALIELIMILDKIKPLDIDRFKSKQGASVSEALAFLLFTSLFSLPIK